MLPSYRYEPLADSSPLFEPLPATAYDDEDMSRLDETADIQFYGAPRFVTHIDDGAISAVTEFYRQTLPEGADVLDICSSWISHLPDEKPLGRVVALGMNARELEANQRATEWVQADLNTSPKLPFEDSSFDAVVRFCCWNDASPPVLTSIVPCPS